MDTIKKIINIIFEVDKQKTINETKYFNYHHLLNNTQLT